ncbi:hypothetical protein Rsub_03618 [Raphidocelis subcapitata]|uniref:Uncharacterized protein n=1 Tax=Raphidocelis subcapitata TaxID=307507 RepID=A0A2V0NUG0_9CHLO|nr:hypothetical protein Rsub_03618 [Raphidocelis subcapitata]|eukprot:GBF91298.1 hypothetical protein Rsub_03618 [Raphidocelis subcapitata]
MGPKQNLRSLGARSGGPDAAQRRSGADGTTPLLTAGARPTAAVELRETCGLEVPAALVWTRWEPGGEYAKTLNVKNVSGRAVTVVHRLNASKAFALDFPAPVRLSPGMSAPLRVVFRPLRRQAYSDAVELSCDGAPLAVPLSAPLPASRLEAPGGVDFGLVPANERTAARLPVANTGAAPLEFSWRVEPPFSVEPAAGRLAPGEGLACEVAFEPREAAAFLGSAACELDSGEVVVVQLSGAAKLPYLTLDPRTLDLGRVPVGRCASAAVRLGNASPVAARFRVGREDAAGEEALFDVSPAEGVLGPGEYGLLTVTFSPRASGARSFQRFSASTAGGNRAPFTARGEGEGPRVALSARAVDFGDVPAGGPAASKVVYIENASEAPAAYEFRDEGGGVFVLSAPRGVVAPRSVAHTRVAFAPRVAANYWRRLVCIVKDAEPISLDVLGTAFDDRSRPPPLTYAHVSAYLARTAAGGEPVPAQGDAAAAEAASPSAASQQQQPSQQQQSQQQAEPLGGEAITGPCGWELLFDGQDPAHALALSEAAVDFGACSRLSAPAPRAVTVTNRTAAKVTVFPCLPAWQDPAAAPPQQPGAAGGGRSRSPSPQRARGSPAGGRAAQSPLQGTRGTRGGDEAAAATAAFQVFPDSLELRPGASGAFKIAFRPPKDGQHYSCAVQIVAFVKAQRNFRLVPADRVVSGNTFSPPFNPEFSPKARLSAPAVAFPPLRPGQAGHQTLAVLNYGDTPVSFDFGRDGLPPALRVVPTSGIAPPRSHAIVALRYAPATAGDSLDAVLSVVFNRVPADAARVRVTGAAHEPLLATSLGPGGRLFLRPTCVGAASARGVELINPGPVATGWRWALSRRLGGAVSVAPAAGVLEGGESCEVTFTFAPRAARVYEGRAAVRLLPPEAVEATLAAAATAVAGGERERSASPEEEGEGGASAGGPDQLGQLVVSVVGEGMPSALSLEPAGGVDFGPLRVGYAARATVALVNQSEGVLAYRIEIEEQPEAAERHGGGGEGAAGGCGRALAADMAAAAAAADAAAEAIVFEEGGGEGGGGGGGGGAEWWLDEPRGAVGGRSQKSLTLTLLPRRRRRYRLRLLAWDASGASEAAADAAAAAGPAEASGGGGEAAAWRPAPLASLEVSADASFPCVLVTDAACDGVAKQVVWRQLGVPALNAALAAPVAPGELRVRALDDGGLMTTDAAAAALPRLEVCLGALAPGGAREFGVMLTNPGRLPAAWELHSWDDPELEPETWVESSKPLTAAEAHRATILSLGIIEAHPRSGRLGPGASAAVALRARGARLGEWRLPLFLRVADGRLLHLELKVSVVPPTAQLPQPPLSFFLAPAPLGEPEPPLQAAALRNGGPGALDYEIDAAPLAGVAKGSYGFEVLKYAGGAPLRGSVPPGDAAVFNWTFQPLEARAYSAALPLAIGGAEPIAAGAADGGGAAVLRLAGRGYHPAREGPDEGETPEEAAGDWRRWLGFDPAPALRPPWRPLRVSPEVLPLGPTLRRGAARQLLRLDNAGPEPMAFCWELGPFDERRGAVAGRLELRPAEGVVGPGGCQIVQAVFTAGVQPQLFEGEVRCLAWPVQSAEEAVAAALAAQEAAEAEALARAVARGAEGEGAEGEGAGQLLDDVIEEIIAVHPPRPQRAPLPAGTLDARLARSRLPLHESMTAASLGKSQALQQRYAASLASLSLSDARRLGGSTAAASAGAGAAGPRQPSGQLPPGFQQAVVVTICGAVLTEAQAKAGAYVPRSERAAAAALVATEARLLPVRAAQADAPPVFLEPPGREGRPAAAEGAAGPAGGSGEAGAAEAVPGGGADGGGAGYAWDADALEAVAGVMEDLLAEALADDAVAAAMDAPTPAPLLVYRGGGVFEELPAADEAGGSGPPAADSGGGGEAAEGGAGGAAGGGGGGGRPSAPPAPEELAFADFVLDSAIVGALQEEGEEGEEGRLGGGRGNSGGGGGGGGGAKT